MTRVENFAPAPSKFSNAFSALADNPTENLGKKSCSSGSVPSETHISGTSHTPTNRTSTRANKASSDSLRDEQKVFTLAKRPSAEPVSVVSTASPAVPATAAPTYDMDVSFDPAPGPSISSLTTSPLLADADLICSRVRSFDQNLADTLQTLLSGLISRLASLEVSQTPTPPPIALCLYPIPPLKRIITLLWNRA